MGLTIEDTWVGFFYNDRLPFDLYSWLQGLLFQIYIKTQRNHFQRRKWFYISINFEFIYLFLVLTFDLGKWLNSTFSL